MKTPENGPNKNKSLDQMIGERAMILEKKRQFLSVIEKRIEFYEEPENEDEDLVQMLVEMERALKEIIRLTEMNNQQAVLRKDSVEIKEELDSEEEWKKGTDYEKTIANVPVITLAPKSESSKQTLEANKASIAEFVGEFEDTKETFKEIYPEEFDTISKLIKAASENRTN